MVPSTQQIITRALQTIASRHSYQTILDTALGLDSGELATVLLGDEERANIIQHLEKEAGKLALTDALIAETLASIAHQLDNAAQLQAQTEREELSEDEDEEDKTDSNNEHRIPSLAEEIDYQVERLNEEGIEINAKNIRERLEKSFSSEIINEWISSQMTSDFQLKLLLDQAQKIDSFKSMLQFTNNFISYLISAAPLYQQEQLKEIRKVAYRNPLDKGDK